MCYLKGAEGKVKAMKLGKAAGYSKLRAQVISVS